MPLREYDALVAKIDLFTAAASARCRDDLQCRRGCAACCHVELSVSLVEADAIRRHLSGLPADVREALRLKAADVHPAAASPRCAMLGADSSCAVYAARPIICRTQGLPLRYPDQPTNWCPLNFTSRAPAAADTLDAGRVDQLLAVVNRRHADRSSQDPLLRVSLRVLALG